MKRYLRSTAMIAAVSVASCASQATLDHLTDANSRCAMGDQFQCAQVPNIINQANIEKQQNSEAAAKVAAFLILLPLVILAGQH